jgi:hypothetical protein
VCVLLVLTLYSPTSHKPNFLRSQAERLVPALIAVWPRDTREDRRRFELLRRAYVEARYSPAYAVTADELAWLNSSAETSAEVSVDLTLLSFRWRTDFHPVDYNLFPHAGTDVA